MFGEGVSVIVGPNGSGKSNITDAVLWALGEQSPLAVRGQTMADVIFSGARGVQARGEAEVELVLDNSDGVVDTGSAEISISRRLDRAGEGSYRLNGAHCRLIDVLELLSDTGLGKEAHSVISQGRVESIVTSKPRDRRLLIEEAAGLGKHRKRRRRAQLKLERTEENLGRALDVEREARGRLRPLKRQAEAAELHERLERQLHEARWSLLRDELRERLARLREREAAATLARESREQTQTELGAVAARREQAEDALARRNERHDAIAAAAFSARGARDRVAMRLESAQALAATIAARVDPARRGARCAASRCRNRGGRGQRPARATRGGARGTRRATRVRARRRAGRARGVAATRPRRRSPAWSRRARRRRRPPGRRTRSAPARARRSMTPSRGSSARGATLPASARSSPPSTSSFAATRPPRRAPARSSRVLSVEPGFELALAAVLGSRLSAALVADRDEAARVLDAAGHDGASALLRVPVAPAPACRARADGRRPRRGRSAALRRAAARARGAPARRHLGRRGALRAACELRRGRGDAFGARVERRARRAAPGARRWL